MDPYDAVQIGRGAPAGYDPQNANDVSLRLNLGYALNYARRMNLAAMSPRADLCSTMYCLANPVSDGGEYLTYLPSGGTVTLDLSATSRTLFVEWFNPASGQTTTGSSVVGGGLRTLGAPFSGDAILYVYDGDQVPATPTGVRIIR